MTGGFSQFAPPKQQTNQQMGTNVGAASVNTNNQQRQQNGNYDMEEIGEFTGGSKKSPRHRKFSVERKTAIGILVSGMSVAFFFGIYMGYQHAGAIERVMIALFGG